MPDEPKVPVPPVDADGDVLSLSSALPEIKVGDSITIEGQTYAWNGTSYSLAPSTPKE